MGMKFTLLLTIACIFAIVNSVFGYWQVTTEYSDSGCSLPLKITGEFSQDGCPSSDSGCAPDPYNSGLFTASHCDTSSSNQSAPISLSHGYVSVHFASEDCEQESMDSFTLIPLKVCNIQDDTSFLYTCNRSNRNVVSMYDYNTSTDCSGTPQVLNLPMYVKCTYEGSNSATMSYCN